MTYQVILLFISHFFSFSKAFLEEWGKYRTQLLTQTIPIPGVTRGGALLFARFCVETQLLGHQCCHKFSPIGLVKEEYDDIVKTETKASFLILSALV